MTRILRILISPAENATAEAEAPPPPPGWLESDIVVIPFALLCVLCGAVVLIVLCEYLWQCLGAGLRKKVLQSLPRFAYVDRDPATWVETPECAICLAEFAGDDEIRVLPQCGHGFHVGCIDTWLWSHSSCPSCRQVLAVGCGSSGESRETSVVVMQRLVSLLLLLIIIIASLIYIYYYGSNSSNHVPLKGEATKTLPALNKQL